MGSHPRLPDSSAQILVDDLFEGAQAADARFVVERKHLREPHGAYAALRIDPEVRVVDSRPAQTALGSILRVARVFHRNLKTETKLVAPGPQRIRTASNGVGRGLLLDDDRADLVLFHHLY